MQNVENIILTIGHGITLTRIEAYSILHATFVSVQRQFIFLPNGACTQDPTTHITLETCKCSLLAGSHSSILCTKSKTFTEFLSKLASQ